MAKNKKIVAKDILQACVVGGVAFVIIFVSVLLYLPSSWTFADCPAIYPAPEWCYERAELFQSIEFYVALVCGGIMGALTFLCTLFARYRALKWLSVLIVMIFIISILRYYMVI